MQEKNASAWSKEEEGGEKKCLPRAIYPPPIIKSHRHDPIRCHRAIWDQKFENLWDQKGNMGTPGRQSGYWGGQYGIIPENDPMEPSLTTSL